MNLKLSKRVLESVGAMQPGKKEETPSPLPGTPELSPPLGMTLAAETPPAPQEPAPGPVTCRGVDCPHASLQHRFDEVAGREILLRWCALSNKPIIDLDTCPAGKWTEKPNMVHQASPTLCRAADTITPCRSCQGLAFWRRASAGEGAPWICLTCHPPGDPGEAEIHNNPNRERRKTK